MLQFCNGMQTLLPVTWLFQNSQHVGVKVRRGGSSLLSAGALPGAQMSNKPRGALMWLCRGPSAPSSRVSQVTGTVPTCPSASIRHQHQTAMETESAPHVLPTPVQLHQVQARWKSQELLHKFIPMATISWQVWKFQRKNTAFKKSVLHSSPGTFTASWTDRKKGSDSFLRHRSQTGGSGEEAASQHLVGQGQLQNKEGACGARALHLQIRWHPSQRPSGPPPNKIMSE